MSASPPTSGGGSRAAQPVLELAVKRADAVTGGVDGSTGPTRGDDGRSAGAGVVASGAASPTPDVSPVTGVTAFVVPATVPPRVEVVPATVPPRVEVVPVTVPPRVEVVPATVPPRVEVVPATVPPRV